MLPLILVVETRDDGVQGVFQIGKGIYIGT